MRKVIPHISRSLAVRQFFYVFSVHYFWFHTSDEAGPSRKQEMTERIREHLQYSKVRLNARDSWTKQHKHKKCHLSDCTHTHTCRGYDTRASRFFTFSFSIYFWNNCISFIFCANIHSFNLLMFAWTSVNGSFIASWIADREKVIQFAHCNTHAPTG